MSTGLVLLFFLLRLGLQPWIGQRSPMLLFIVAVVLAAGIYGAGPGLLAIALSAIIATLAFIAPSNEAGLDTEQIVNIAVFLGTGGAMLLFANHMRKTRQRTAELELELQNAQANAAMGAMAATLAHELNQPLAAASNYVSACQRFAADLDGQRSQAVVDGLSKAEGQIQRAAVIIRNARSMVKNMPVERESSSLRRMAGRVIDLLAATKASRDVRFEVDVPPESDKVSVNTSQIEQVLLNLLRNACEAIRKTGSAGRIRLNAVSTDRGRFIEIRDNGPGIPSPRLASLFSTAHGSSTGGIGIGLSICRTIVEAHGGNIWAQNNPEGGASFFLLLPDADSALNSAGRAGNG